MKKLGLIFCSLLVFISSWANADAMDAKETLKQRLAKRDGFYAEFTQVVKTADGELVQEGTGELWVDRPYYFNWFMSEPDETSIISDGETIWVYAPLVEQVTATWLKDVADNRLLLLITNNQSAVWNVYDVAQKGDKFELIPNDDSAQRFDLVVLSSGMINEFTIYEEDGQASLYKLTNQKMGAIDKKIFQFTLPDGVELDDQR